MGAGASVDKPISLEEAKAKAGDKFDQAKWDALAKGADGKATAAAWNAAANAANAPAAATNGTANGTAAVAATAATAVSDGVDREGIERNANGSEEPNSADPELWNIDGCEIDYLVKYKLGGQMWYVQSRCRENPKKNMPIPGFPMNKKAEDAKRWYKKEDDAGNETEFNTENTPTAGAWNTKTMQVLPP